MTVHFSDAVRNGRAQATETAVGTSPLLRMYTGSAPANCAATVTGTKCVEMTLPSDWMSNPSAGVSSKVGTWEQTSATATGTVGYYRIYDSAGTTCHEQGTITATGSGGDLTIDNTSVNAGQDVIVTSYQTTEGNA